MAESRLELLRNAAELFASSLAVNAYEYPWGHNVCFRIGAREISILTDSESETHFVVNVYSGLQYEGRLRLKVFLVDEIVECTERKSLLIEGDGFYMNDGKRYHMLPGPSYSLLALGVVVSSFFGFFLYEMPVDLEECKMVARKLLNDINAAAEVPKTRPWEDNPELLENMVESYISLVTWSFDYY